MDYIFSAMFLSLTITLHTGKNIHVRMMQASLTAIILFGITCIFNVNGTDIHTLLYLTLMVGVLWLINKVRIDIIMYYIMIQQILDFLALKFEFGMLISGMLLYVLAYIYGNKLIQIKFTESIIKRVTIIAILSTMIFFIYLSEKLVSS